MSAARPFTLALLLAGSAPTAFAQLRPRRVGVGSMGDQEAMPTGEAAAVGGGAGMENMASMMQNLMQGDGMEGIAEAMQAMMGGGEGGLEAMMKGLQDSPLMKGLMSNPEVAEALSNPEALQERMQEMTKMFSGEDGQALGKNLMKEFTEQMTDPEKLKASFAQLKDDPMMAGLVDAVPGFKEAMENPEEIAEQVAAAFGKTQEMLEGIQSGDNSMLQEMMGESMKKAQELLQAAGGAEGGGLGDLGDLGGEGMAELLANLGQGGGLEGLAEMFGQGGVGLDGDEDAGLKGRVRESMAEMLRARGGAAAVDVDDEF